MSRFDKTQVKHVSCEANKCVDALAKRGCQLFENFVTYIVSPSEVVFLLSLVATSLYFNRITSIATSFSDE